MSTKTPAVTSAPKTAPRKAVKESKAMGFASGATPAPFLTHFATCQVSDVPKRRKARRIPRPKQSDPVDSKPSLSSGPALAHPINPLSGLLSRALSWLRSAGPAPKQLRVADTVSLGEKRFVAILHAEGRKFLIGGGATSVSLLKQLDETPESTRSVDFLAGLSEPTQ